MPITEVKGYISSNKREIVAVIGVAAVATLIAIYLGIPQYLVSPMAFVFGLTAGKIVNYFS